MTINEQIKILDDKIRSNQAQYDLDRQNAKISALSSGELDKYEYLTGENMGYKPYVVQKAKSEYSPLSQLFNKGLEKDEKPVGLFKRLKNIEDKTDNQLAIQRSPPNVKSISYSIKDRLSLKAKSMLDKLVIAENSIDYRSLCFIGGNNVDYDFRSFRSVTEFFKSIYNGHILIPAAERGQDDFEDILNEV